MVFLRFGLMPHDLVIAPDPALGRHGRANPTVRRLDGCERRFGIDRDRERERDPDPVLDRLERVPAVRVPGGPPPCVRAVRSEGEPVPRVLDGERAALVGTRHDEREARHHAGHLLGVGVQGEMPAHRVDEELEGFQLGLRGVAKAHLLRHRPEHLPSKSIPGGSFELHPVRSDLAGIADRRIQQRVLAATVGRGPGETEQTLDVFGRRRACEGPARNLEHRTLFALARRPGRGGELGREQRHEPGPVAAVGDVRRVRAPLAGTKVVTHGRVHHQSSGWSLAAWTLNRVSVG